MARGAAGDAPRSPFPEVDDGQGATVFILRLGKALHRYGTPTDRIEEWLGLLAGRLGVHGEFFCTPTALFATLQVRGPATTHLIRLEPGSADLGRLVDLDRIANQVYDADLTPTEGIARIDDVLARGERYPAPVMLVATAAACAASNVFLGGTAREVAATAGIGLVVGVVESWMGLRQRMARLSEAVAAFCAALLTHAFAVYFGGLDPWRTMLSGLIVLLPGLRLTVAMHELAVQHLAAGTARLMGAIMTLLLLGVGVGLGTAAAAAAGLQPPATPVLPPLPAEVLWAAALVAPVSFAVLFRARLRDVPWIVPACLVAFLAARFGGTLLGPRVDLAFGAAFGAFCVGLYSNVYARVSQRPAQVTSVPAILMLVPGSLGLTSIGALLREDVLAGVPAAFRMVMVAASLVAGLLLANLVVPSRKIL